MAKPGDYIILDLGKQSFGPKKGKHEYTIRGPVTYIGKDRQGTHHDIGSERFWHPVVFAGGHQETLDEYDRLRLGNG